MCKIVCWKLEYLSPQRVQVQRVPRPYESQGLHEVPHHLRVLVYLEGGGRLQRSVAAAAPLALHSRLPGFDIFLLFHFFILLLLLFDGVLVHLVDASFSGGGLQETRN